MSPLPGNGQRGLAAVVAYARVSLAADISWDRLSCALVVAVKITSKPNKFVVQSSIPVTASVDHIGTLN